ncbi:hypothetical protein [Nostoc sp. FACHB-280]|nr:hypothetical protein [Nostoc sp. FACHB-280]
MKKTKAQQSDKDWLRIVWTPDDIPNLASRLAGIRKAQMPMQ